MQWQSLLDHAIEIFVKVFHVDSQFHNHRITLNIKFYLKWSFPIWSPEPKHNHRQESEAVENPRGKCEVID